MPTLYRGAFGRSALRTVDARGAGALSAVRVLRRPCSTLDPGAADRYQRATHEFRPRSSGFMAAIGLLIMVSDSLAGPPCRCAFEVDEAIGLDLRDVGFEAVERRH